MIFSGIFRFLACCTVVFMVLIGANASAQDQTVTPFSAPDASDISTSAAELEILIVPMTNEELSELATVWQGHIKQVLKEIAVLNLELVEANAARDAAIRAELAALLDQQRGV